MRLNLGCSDRHLAGFVNVDIVPPADELVDLTKPWPWGDDSVSLIEAEDIIEHLPDKIHTMNEIWRVLCPGGDVRISVPTTDGPGAWQDPGHVSYWNRNSFLYYTDGDPHFTRFHAGYGIKAHFAVVSERKWVGANQVPKLDICLRAVKP